MSFDPTTLTIIARGLQSASEEMATNLIRSAFSAVVREARDCSTALLDAEGRVVAQAEMIPIQTAALSAAFAAARAVLDLETIRPGHFILLNDPYSGGQHLNDIILFSPIFADDGSLLAYAGSTAHHLDIGGGSAGINTAARELIQEGIVIPPLLLDYERDWNGGNFERFFFANIRTPDIGRGDMDAQFAANFLGAQRVLALARRHGVGAVRAAMAGVLDYSERRMRAAIAEIPDGRWTGTALIDGDGIAADGPPLAIEVSVEVAGDAIVLDFTGTAAQVGSMFNSPLASSIAAAVTAVRAVLSDTGIPANDGCNRPLTIILPEGSILNPRPGAPVRARATASTRALDAVHDALGQIIPERIPAQGNNTTTGLFMTHAPKGGRMRIHLDILGGGWGAAKGYDAINATDHILSSCRLTPTESIEQIYDHLLMESFGLCLGSGGSGANTGGMGIFRRYRITADGVTLSIYSDRFRLPPLGRSGGRDGARSSLVVERGDERIALGANSTFALSKGDVVEIRIAGGGGWGDPRERERAEVERDLDDGFITAETAREVYGLTTRQEETAA
ncbi:hydantoinase B/oxoprolinase family protein [Bosea sp. (in: a-proteobacteria)]|uniref:hydantoinase B/oxoprolinase family protein n=1 Tax=Bosea sp. (in: a-proteobacteria) TaxID=1871050 RepID=UPI002613102E|nr:hydantoinase B/oxoprolinase family protein [Bosea sp. (in: a-proteobacteria)]MCO5093142.1 hydantoinase B/oxoprolinase family protein [Bosea sp. (in: a-proteobacteria)]